MPTSRRIASCTAALSAVLVAALSSLAGTPEAQASGPHQVHKAHKTHKAHAAARHHRAACRRAHRHGRRTHSRCAHISVAGPARPYIGWAAPLAGDTRAVGHYVPCRVVAATRRTVVRVDFYADNVKVGTDQTAPYQCRWPAERMTPGNHGLRAVALDTNGQSHAARITMRVGARPAPPAPPATPDWRQGTAWSDSFESGDFTKWSWWGQGDSSYGHRAVIDCQREGVPARDGARAARFETTPDDIANGRYHAKLFRSFGSNLGTANARSPANVSGTYSSWYYFPTNYKMPDGKWTSIFQFKEQYRAGGDVPSDPLWWVQLGNGPWAKGMAGAWGQTAPAVSRPDAPVAFINHWNNDWKAKRNFVTVPLGRWFEIKAVVKQNDRIDFYLDGHLLDTANQAEYPVSPFHGAASAAWIFGIGNYSDAANGPLYADQVSYRQG